MKTKQVYRYIAIVALISFGMSMLVHFNSVLELFTEKNSAFRGNYGVENSGHVIGEVIVTALVAFCTFMLNYFIIRPLDNLKKVGYRRIMASIILTLASVYLLSDLFFAMKHLINEVNNPNKINPLYFFRDLFTAIIVLTCVYLIKLFYDRQAILIENERLMRENLQSQYESLKNQLSPHFLFNSLTALKTLINDSPSTAQDYVNNLSKALRYTLQSNEKQLVTLKEELDFTESYLFLIKMRFDTNLTINIGISKKYLSYLLPPLTIQTLVENAVKHNEVSKRKPLTIEIQTTDIPGLIILNNIQEKITEEEGTGIGLINLSRQFNLLIGKEIFISKDNNEFRVEVPLISPREYESVDHRR